MNEAIRLAIGGGYELAGKLSSSQLDDTDWHNVFLFDPKFWQALGKALGWTNRVGICRVHGIMEDEMFDFDDPTCKSCMSKRELEYPLRWAYEAHNYLDIKLTGGDEEAFWEGLLK